jgi:hypothetical protein
VTLWIRRSVGREAAGVAMRSIDYTLEILGEAGSQLVRGAFTPIASRRILARYSIMLTPAREVIA